jgi:hypothetical protein
MYTICAGEGLQNAVRTHHGDEKGKKVQGVASVKIRVTLHARQLDKGAASASPITAHGPRMQAFTPASFTQADEKPGFGPMQTKGRKPMSPSRVKPEFKLQHNFPVVSKRELLFLCVFAHSSSPIWRGLLSLQRSQQY